MKIQESIASEFDEFLKDYTNDMIKCVPHYLKLISSFTEHLPEKFSPQNILDLGCGNGNVTSNFTKLFPKANYTLLDASSEMLTSCKGRFKDYSVEYVESYFNDFIFKEDKYDLVVAGFSLHHCNSSEKRTLFQNIYSSLKNKGIFSFSDLMINKNTPEHSKLLSNWETFVNNNFPDVEKWQWLMEHYNEFDKPDDYKNQMIWLKEAGFNHIKIKSKDEYWMHLQAIKN